MELNYRPVRVLMDSKLLRRLDDVLASGVGGFESRDELVGEAVNSYLLELQEVVLKRQQPASSYGVGEGVGLHGVRDSLPAGGGPHAASLSAIPFPGRGFVGAGAPVNVEPGPMLGLHSRDWPSFWALGRLGVKAAEGPVSFRAFLEEVTDEAWSLVEELRAQLGDNAKAATQMLPTNVLKKQSADAGFQNFAVATVSNKRGSDGLHRAAGPLATWGAVAFSDIGAGTGIAVSAQGWDLLEVVHGLSPEAPHSQSVARQFFHYLQAHAPLDWWGFKTILREVADSPARNALLARMESARDWRSSVAGSVTQGYIARSREWGLVEPKLMSGCYRLTDFGKEVLENV